MLDKTDMNKMHLKDNHAKKRNGAVYGTLKGITDFHEIEKMPIASLDNKELLEIIHYLFEEQKVLLDKIKVLKEVALLQKERLEKIEKVVANYVG